MVDERRRRLGKHDRERSVKKTLRRRRMGIAEGAKEGTGERTSFHVDLSTLLQQNTNETTAATKVRQEQCLEKNA
jgi:hypothetical protein